MMRNSFCQLWLTCKDKEEADKISNTLLVKYLIACSKQIQITSDYRWQDKIEHADEILLIMDSKLDLFDQIEAEVKKLHSYDTFVLQAVPISKVSSKAEKWLEQQIRLTNKHPKQDKHV